MRIYLDNCCFNRPYDNQAQIRISLEAQAKLYIQNLIRQKSDGKQEKAPGFPKKPEGQWSEYNYRTSRKSVISTVCRPSTRDFISV